MKFFQSRIGISLLGLGLMMSALSTNAQADAATAPGFVATPEHKVERKIVPFDNLTIEVYGEEDLTVARRVQQDGSIQYPLLNIVKAAGKTPRQLAEEMKKDLIANRFLVDPQVSVDVKEFAVQTVNVTGAVNKGGKYPLPGDKPWTIIDAISQAGGFAKSAKEDQIRLTRDGKTKQYRWSDLLKMEDSDQIYLQANDLIFVPESFL